MGTREKNARRMLAWVACAGVWIGAGQGPARSAATAPQTAAGPRAVDARGAHAGQRGAPGPAAATGRAGKKASSAKTGTLRLDYADFDLTLLGPAGERSVSGHSGQVVLPAATYTLMAWTLRARGADGRLWQARGGMGVDDLVIQPGRVTRLNLASPLKARWVSTTRGRPQLLELRFTGTSGEECCGVGVDGQGPPSPHYEIRDPAGQRVMEGEIRFCCKFRGSAVWAPDAAAHGRFTAHVTADWGPFPVRMERPMELDVSESAVREAPLSLGSLAPDLALRPTEGGSELVLSSLRGRPVALCFFCGCGPCQTVAEGVSSLPDTMTVAVVADLETFRGDHLRQFRAKTGFRGPVLVDRDGEAARAYWSISCPRVWLLDRDGRIAYRHDDLHVDPAQVLAGLRAARAALDTPNATTKAAKLD
jgi:peroxiredoxin